MMQSADREKKVKLTTITNIEDLGAIETDWLKLLEHPGNKGIHQSCDWFKISCRAFHPNDELHVLLVYDEEGSLACIAPLVITWRTYRGIRVRTIGFARNEQSPANDFIFTPGSEESCLALILEYLTTFKRWEFIELQMVDVNNPTGELIHNFLGRKGLPWGVQLNRQSPYIPIDKTWDDYWNSRSKRFRKAMRNKLNRAGRQDGLVIEKRAINNGSGEALAEMIEISRNSWKREAGTDLAAREDRVNFYKLICDEWGPKGLIHLWLLKVDSKAAAFEFHIEYEDIVYPVRADYDERCRDISPGSVLEYEIIKNIFLESRLKEYNSCGHTYEYLMNWTDLARDYRDIQVFKRSPKMMLLHAFEYRLLVMLRKMKSYERLKKIYHRLASGTASGGRA